MGTAAATATIAAEDMVGTGEEATIMTLALRLPARELPALLTQDKVGGTTRHSGHSTTPARDKDRDRDKTKAVPTHTLHTAATKPT